MARRKPVSDERLVIAVWAGLASGAVFVVLSVLQFRDGNDGLGFVAIAGGFLGLVAGVLRWRELIQRARSGL